MRRTEVGILILLFPLLFPCPGYGAEPDSCVECHQFLPDELGAPVTTIEKDVHYLRGLSCADCHGGDPADPDLTAMGPEKGFRPTPTKPEIPQFCGRCHSDEAFMRRFAPQLPTDQEAQYKTSIHGQRLVQGDEKVATCVSCHGVHGILPVDQVQSPVHPANVARTCARCHADAAYMKGYGLPTDQFARYQTSVHGVALCVQRDLSAPACNDCHGNHGAYPPGADSVAVVCGQCHAINRDFFVKSPHKAAFDRLGLPECVTCHGNHEVLKTADEMLGVGDVAICVTCHAPESAGYQVAKVLRQRLEDLKAAMRDAERVLAAAERAGMEVGEVRYEFQGVHQTLIQARNVVHACSAQDLQEVIARGEAIASTTIQAGNNALAELQVRRRMMLIPLTALGLVMILLYAKIRDLERH
jgi:hypothetical protein